MSLRYEAGSGNEYYIKSVETTNSETLVTFSTSAIISNLGSNHLIGTLTNNINATNYYFRGKLIGKPTIKLDQRGLNQPGERPANKNLTNVKVEPKKITWDAVSLSAYSYSDGSGGHTSISSCTGIHIESDKWYLDCRSFSSNNRYSWSLSINLGLTLNAEVVTVTLSDGTQF